MIFHYSGNEYTREPNGKSTLGELIASLSGVTFRSPCGGHGVCRKCAVVTCGPGNADNPAGIAALSPAEREQLLKKARVPREKWENARIRLACLCRDFAGIDEVYLPDADSLTGAGVSATAADVRSPDYAPLAEVRTVPLPLPDEIKKAASPRIRAEAEELERAGEASAYAVFATEFLPLPEGEEADFARQKTGERIVSLGKEKPSPLGLAVDIGTTTVAASVWSLTDGARLGETVSENPQRRYGADVISRMSYSEEHGDGELRRLILSAVQENVKRILADHLAKTGEKREPDEIVCAVFAGNSVMEHLFLGLPTDTIARAPFVLRTRLGCSFTPAEVFPGEFAPLRCTSPEASLYFAPLAASYVGGDITLGLAYLLTTREELAERTGTNALFLDLGTNGELCVVAGQPEKPETPRFLFAATAAGPALEGAQISMGMSALPGAVTHVRADVSSGEFDCRILGEGEPTGICGSGVISAVAAALDTGLITEYGRICDDGEPENEAYAEVYEAFEHAIGENDDGRLTIAFAGDVKLTDSDVRQVQTAKAAVAAGTRVLLDVSGIGGAQLDRVYLAGSFGGGIDVNAAVRIGLLPRLLPKGAGGKVLSVGNTSAAGAVMQLFRRGFREKLREVMERSRYIELSCDPAFTEAFVDGMMFD